MKRISVVLLVLLLTSSPFSRVSAWAAGLQSTVMPGALSCPLSPSQSEFDLEEKIRLIFDMTFLDSRMYEPGNCSSNIWRLLKTIKACGLTLPKSAEVLYLTEPNLRVALEFTRVGREEWYFHVALLVNGSIYDFDFGPTPSHPLAKEYFQQTFQSQVDTDYGKLAIRVVPAQQYLEIYRPDDVTRNFYYFLLPENSTYPEYRIRHFLQRF